MASEVLIIGGGVIGLSIARELASKGVRGITVVDRGVLGKEASWAAAGMLAPDVEAADSDEFYRLSTESLGLYPDFAEALEAESGIDIELDRSGTLYVALTATDVDRVNSRYDRCSPAVSVERLSASELRGLEPHIADTVLGGLFFPKNWQVENRKLLAALRRSVELTGVEILENVDVAGLRIDESRVTSALTSAGVLEADTVVLATGAWTSLIKIGELTVPVKPIRGQMICFTAELSLLKRVVYSPRGYLVPRADRRILVGATVEDVGFDNRTTPEAVEALRLAGSEVVPELSKLTVSESWSGLRPFVADELPVIGRLPGFDNAFVATAHYRNGILLAPKTAGIIADAIAGTGEDDYLRTFGPQRLVMKAVNMNSR